MNIFGVSNSAKDLDIPCLVKFKGAMTAILMGPVGQFQSVNKGGVQIVQRGSQDMQMHKNATLASLLLQGPNLGI